MPGRNSRSTTQAPRTPKTGQSGAFSGNSDYPAILCLVIGAFTLLSLLSFNPKDPSFNVVTERSEVSNLCGLIGSYTADAFVQLIGPASFLVPAVLLLASLRLFLRARRPMRWSDLAATATFILTVSSLMDRFGPWGASRFPADHAGGTLGAFFHNSLFKFLGSGGELLVTFTVLTLSFLHLIGIPLRNTADRAGSLVWGAKATAAAALGGMVGAYYCAISYFRSKVDRSTGRAESRGEPVPPRDLAVARAEREIDYPPAENYKEDVDCGGSWERLSFVPRSGWEDDDQWEAECEPDADFDDELDEPMLDGRMDEIPEGCFDAGYDPVPFEKDDYRPDEDEPASSIHCALAVEGSIFGEALSIRDGADYAACFDEESDEGLCDHEELIEADLAVAIDQYLKEASPMTDEDDDTDYVEIDPSVESRPLLFGAYDDDEDFARDDDIGAQAPVRAEAEPVDSMAAARFSGGGTRVDTAMIKNVRSEVAADPEPYRDREPLEEIGPEPETGGLNPPATPLPPTLPKQYVFDPSRLLEKYQGAPVKQETAAVPPPGPLQRDCDEALDPVPRKAIEVCPRADANPAGRSDAAEPSVKEDDYVFPPTDLLDLPHESARTVEQEVLERNAATLEQKLSDLGVKGQVVAIHPGPVITMYELSLAPGIPLRRVLNMSDDLAMALKSGSTRVVAPIPGKDTVGIEVPNLQREIVYFREIIESKPFRESNTPLKMALGKGIDGDPFVTSLTRMPHLLIAGATGTGKSVGLNGLICSWLMSCHPDDLKLLLVDPKKLELSSYQDVPHLLHPVVTDADKVPAVLGWAIKEMERRYDLLSKVGSKNIDSYNRKFLAGEIVGDEENPAKKLPYIVIIVDELAELMMVAAKDIEISIARLAQMARASGIHLVLATQRPSVDVITGIIKANFPARLSYQVSARADSRTILDTVGAEHLLGRGDMLFLPPGTSKMRRLHGAYISEEEITAIVDFIKQQRAPVYLHELSRHVAGEIEKASGSDISFDEKYDDAVELVTRLGHASISLIQRHMRIGYNRAARIIEAMESEGVIGPSDGTSRPREVLVGSLGHVSDGEGAY
ncbi:MAG: DNA translocase FtsK 4TM domain-containing protein [Pseudomonadota bacterium]